VILKSETYNFHRLDLTRQAGFIVTVYDEDGLKLAATKLMLNACRGVCGSAKNRGQQNRRSKKKRITASGYGKSTGQAEPIGSYSAPD
jgi:hypothetical protein